MESAATGGAAHPPGACDPPQNCGGYMSLVGHWEEAQFPAGINLVQTMAPGWRQIVSEVALDLITIPAVSALGRPPLHTTPSSLYWTINSRPPLYFIPCTISGYPITISPVLCPATPILYRPARPTLLSQQTIC